MILTAYSNAHIEVSALCIIVYEIEIYYVGHSSCLSGFAGQVKSRQAEISVTQGFQKQKLQAAALYVYTEPV